MNATDDVLSALEGVPSWLKVLVVLAMPFVPSLVKYVRKLLRVEEDATPSPVTPPDSNASTPTPSTAPKPVSPTPTSLAQPPDPRMDLLAEVVGRLQTSHDDLVRANASMGARHAAEITTMQQRHAEEVAGFEEKLREAGDTIGELRATIRALTRVDPPAPQSSS